MRNGSFALLTIMALGFMGVEITHHETAATGSARPAQADASPEPGLRHPSPTSDRALRLIADHWGLFLRTSDVSTISTEREDSRETKAAGATIREKTTAKGTRDLDAADALTLAEKAKVIRRFRDSKSRTLIVTLPDPIDSDLDIEFDRFIETIQRVVGQQHFVLDRHDIPWPRGDRSKSDEGSGSTRYREQPGLLLFRQELSNAPAPAPLLLVLLVGETPIAGVQQLAFRSALVLAHQLAPGNASDGPIQVLGPTLSGSVTSLRLGVCEAFVRNGPTRVSFLATTATRDSNMAKLTFGPGSCHNGAKVTSEYASATHDDTTLFAGLADFLRDRGFSGTVAVLSESNSAYGLTHEASMSVATNPDDAAPMPCRQPRGPIAFECFSFPMRIAQLRAAYDRQRIAPTKGSTTTPSTALELSFGGAHGSRELPPVYSTALAANAAERVLVNTFETIARHRYRYLVILSTDMRDRLFLAQLARAHLSNVQLVFFDSDVLQTHPDIAAEVEGVLVVTGYPLFLGKVPDSDRRLREFPNTGTVAMFNGAAELLFGMMSSPAPPTYVGLEAAPEGGLRPRVWVAVVNRLHEWPLASYPPVARTADGGVEVHFAGSSKAATDFKLRGMGYGVALVPVTIAMVACFLGWLLTAAPLTDFGSADWRDRAARAAVLVTRHGPAWVLLALAGVLTASLWQQDKPSSGVVAVLGLMLLPGLVWHPKLAPRSFLRLGQVGLMLLITVALLVTAWRLGTDVTLEDARLLLIGSGLDNRLPLALLVGAIIVLIATQPLQAIDHRFYARLNPFVRPWARAAAVRSFDVFHGLIGSDLFWTRNGFALRCGAASVIAFGVLAPLLDPPILRLASFEGSRYDIAARLLLIVLSLAIGLAGIQAYCVWGRIRQLLCRLDWHPIHSAFDRLPGHLAHNLGLRGSLRFPSVSELGFSIEQAGMVANHLDQLGTWYPPERVDPHAMLGVQLLRIRAVAEDWAKGFRCEIEQSERGLGAGRGIDSVTMARLLDVSRGIFEMLEAVWDARPLKAALLGSQKAWPDPGKGGEEHSVHVYERNVPDEFHAWIRLCEDFAATMTVLYLRCVFVLLKRLLLGVIAATLLLLFAVVSYPFQPRGGLTSWAFGFVVALLGLGIVLIVQTERDPILSRLANTEANKLTFSSQLVTQFGLYVCLPAIILLTTQFPRLRDVLGRLVEPLMRSVQG